MRHAHAMPFGAELADGGGARFRLWAPAPGSVALRLEGRAAAREEPMRAEGDGWWLAEVADAAAGDRYRFRVDDGPGVPDPASRSQPDGVHGASELVDPRAFDWRDDAWRGRPWEEAVLYELHVGAFSPEGSFGGVVRRLDHLAALGVTALELMPLAECPGKRNWGYDGVLPFAPESRYGRPDDLKALVEAAHERDLMVLLDVVYNHFGPEGNQLARYAPDFFTERYTTPWGAAIDFDGPRSGPVRDFFVHNALYWLEEFRFDGLRLDAVHAIHDDSRPDVLSELAERVRARFGGERHVHLVLENDRNEAQRLERDARGRPVHYDAQWNDDAHHALHVLLTAERDGYYADYAERPAELLGRCLTEGFAYQGQPSAHRGGAPRGEPSAGLPPVAFVSFLQNHDQVGNRAFAERIGVLAEPAAVEAAAALLLLAPSPPLLFMGEEWDCRQPFPFFCDFGPELTRAVREGRRREFSRFPAFRSAEALARIPDACAPETFTSAVLRWKDLEREPHRDRLALYRHLLALRGREIAPRLAGTQGHAAAYTLLGDGALDASWRLGDGARLALRANLEARPLAGRFEPLPGRRLFATHPQPGGDEAGELPPWSVAWHLDRGGAPSAPDP